MVYEITDTFTSTASALALQNAPSTFSTSLVMTSDLLSVLFSASTVNSCIRESARELFHIPQKNWNN